jgi:2-keto-3-deoxy-L-rhamnonate aldolase RhmA
MPRSNWSRPLPRALVIPTVMTLRTLDDVRELMRHLPEENRSKATWRYVASQLDKVATETLDAAEVEIALRLVLMLEGVKCRPK